MKVLIITVAGMSSRFSESVGFQCLKCIYNKGSIEESLLYQMIHMNESFDYYVVVGGFMFEQLKDMIEQSFSDIKDKIILIKNEHYFDYGSGYSLYMGLRAIEKLPYKEVVFAEGDLFVDKETFNEICYTDNNVVTCNSEPILASKAVAFYYDEDYKIHYIYDTNHSALQIDVPFLAIFNSGQIWKFAQSDILRKLSAEISEEAWRGTNLVLIQKYFGGLSKDQYKTIMFRKWINCNTIYDYNKTIN